MSYYYQDPEYANYSNHGNEYDEYESYLDYAKPDHCEYEDTQYHNNRDYKDIHEGTKYEHGEPKYKGDEVHELEELEYIGDKVQALEELTYNNDGTGMDWEEGYGQDIEGYKHRGLEYEGNGVHELQELKYVGNKVYELRELEHGEREVHELRELANHEDEAQELRELALMYDKWGCEPPASLYNEHGNTNGPTYVHTPATPSPPYSPAYDNNNRYAHAPTNPYSHPPRTLPSTYPLTRPSLDTSESHDHIKPEERAHTPSLYSNLDELRHKYNLGIPSAITYMQGLQEYTEECLREQKEWKADEWAEIRKNHWIKYPNATSTPPRAHGIPPTDGVYPTP
jgi:hypothetical protein